MKQTVTEKTDRSIAPRADLLTPYQQETLRPIVCLAFVIPLILIYELGAIALGPHSLRTGVDQWMHQLLASVGFGHMIILPLLTTVILVAWHHRRRDQVRVRPATLAGMVCESVGLGLILFWAANACHLMSLGDVDITQASLLPDLTSAFAMSVPTEAAVVEVNANNQWWAMVVAFVGSGLYEELVFRLIFMLSLIHWVGSSAGNRKVGCVVGILVTSLVFASLHYQVFNPAGVEFEMGSFIFRFAASVVFCLLFIFRGFGIAVGTHVAYDILTQL